MTYENKSAFETSFVLTGGDIINKKMEKLSIEVQGTINRKALREGAKLIAKEARSRVPVKSGGLKRSIIVGDTKRASKNWKKSNISVGIDRSPVGRGYHAHLIEFGTKERTSRFGSRGRVRRQPFMRPAFDQTKHKSLTKIQDITLKEIDKVARKKGG